METTSGVWVAFFLGGLPILGCLMWLWNEIWYALPLKFRYSGTGTRLPPGHMGIPFFGEMITFLWYFKVLRRPDELINSKRRKYGDGVGMYRTHLFGSPSIIACFPAINKFVFWSDDVFIHEWPNVDLVGQTSLGAVHGEAHTRLRSFVSNALNRPDALRRITAALQPGMVAALQSWAQKGRVKMYDEAKKVTFENIGKLFVSFEPGPLLDTMDKLFNGLVQGIRAQPSNFPGTAFRRAIQCRKKLEAIFRVQLEKKKNQSGAEKSNDLMDGLMQIEDDEGKKLSDQEVLDNIVSLVIAGYQSTSLSSMWALYFLAKFPNVLEKLREENMAIKRDKKGDFLTSEDVSKMKYTNKVVEETLRMANVSATVFRLATKEVEFEGYKIPKGWKVIIWLRYLHTNPENFDDPMCFNPDRWNKPARSGTYQVFGGGSRICAGNMLARLQIALFLHHLSVGYKWELLNPDADMNYLPYPIPADGVEVKISEI
ncbi:Cytochrome P450 family ent-kaurenoic acid oxidase [Melia azedarach]|uniref:Cytochrome P450 family ent-kaurenoic acid oxidase n=1 Tax=Melia azedarach TaxID=155640 RepID=A0ACC1YBD1_MELAZ|nr:Cytochrome P450 family ent-kaurenoic acid oxidase [Melia azedarach]